MALCNRFVRVLVLVSFGLGLVHSVLAVPQDLTASDWSEIQSQIRAHSFEARTSEDGALVAFNPSHGWQVDFQADGQTVLSPNYAPQTDYSIALQLRAWGYGDALLPVTGPPTLSANAQTVTYQWSSNVREWWINSARGVEQWFELSEPPCIQRQYKKPLVLSMRLNTELKSEVRDNVLHLTSTDGETHLTYDRLKVWDASGRVLPSAMVLSGDRLALQIDDTRATYPITIDPTFSQQAYLKASNTDPGDLFGLSVAVSGDTVVVGALLEGSAAVGVDGDQSDNTAIGAGAAYVFVRNGTSWSQQAYLKASNTDPGDRFGRSVAISDDTVVVGADNERSTAVGVNGDQSDNTAIGAGAVYVFVRNGTSWSQQAYLKASNTDPGDIFGRAVAIAGETVVVGAPSEASAAVGVDGDQSDNTFNNAGAAYVFVRNGTNWSQQAYLKASNTDPSDNFGASVTIAGDTVVVGALSEGSAAVGVDGDPSDNTANAAGAAYVFVRNGMNWSQQAYLKAPNAEAFDCFGGSIAISDDTVVVGALEEDSAAVGIDGDQSDNTADAAGAAYVFVRNGTSWSQQAYLKASNAEAFDGFGGSVAIAVDTVVVGTSFEDSAAVGVDDDQSDNTADAAGAAYVFGLAAMIPEATAVPTLHSIGLVLMILLLAVLGLIAIRSSNSA